MSDLSRAIPLLPRAARIATDVIERIPDGGWADPSPCEGWTVRDVVNHLTAEHLWVPRLLGGATIEEVGDDFDGDVLGEAPVDAWSEAITRSLQAWRSADPEQQIQMSYGAASAAEYANQMLVDLVVHAWDIARGAKIPVTLDPECVEACLAYEEPRVDPDGVEGLFGPSRTPRSGAPADRLLAMVGREVS
ncbi:TIGR03086 family metal-binding protein [Mariniluteicoccus flavus]